MPTSTPGSGTPSRPRNPPNAITSGNVTGSSQIAGAPSCAPHRPTATIASTWSRPDTGCSSPVTKPAAWPDCSCAQAGTGKQRSTSGASKPVPFSVEAVSLIATLPAAPPCAGSSSRRRASRPHSPAAPPRARPMDLQHAEGALQQQDQRRTKRELSDFDADIEHQQRERDLRRRQPHRRQPAGEAEAVQQPEGEGHDPGVADREARLPAPRAHDLGAEEQDRQRDRRIQRQQRRARVAERGHRQRDAVRQRERGDRLHQHPAVAHDQQQPQHEQQVVDAEQDVLDAEAQVRRPNAASAVVRSPSVTDGFIGLQQVRLDASRRRARRAPARR